MKSTPIKLFSLFSLLILISISVKGQWDISLFEDEYFYDFTFINENTGWAIGNYSLFKTTDGGKNWSQKSVPTSNANEDVIYFINSQIGFVGGGSTVGATKPTYLYRTTDGGSTWHKGADRTGGAISSFYFINEKIGYFTMPYANAKNSIYKTTDAGETWENLSPETLAGNVSNVYFINETIGFAISGGLFKTYDGGKNWTRILNDIREIQFLDDKNGYALSTSHDWVDNVAKVTFYITNDGGDSWIKKRGSFDYDKSSIPRQEKIFFVDDKIGYIIMNREYLDGWVNRKAFLYKTIDGGNNWETEPIETDVKKLYDIHFFNKNYGFIAGQKYILRFIQTPVSVNKVENREDEIKIFTSRNILKIEKSLNLKIQDIRIYNLLGLQLGNLPTNKSSFDISYLESGIYIIYIKGEDRVFSQKFVAY